MQLHTFWNHYSSWAFGIVTHGDGISIYFGPWELELIWRNCDDYND